MAARAGLVFIANAVAAWSRGFSLMQHQIHAQHGQYLHEPARADRFSIALQGGIRLLAQPQAFGDLALRQAGLFPEGSKQARKLIRGTDGEFAHSVLNAVFRIYAV